MDIIVTFGSETLTIAGRTLPFDPYYFGIQAEYAGRDIDTGWVSIVQEALQQWVEALAILAPREMLFLPFGVYDQCTECLIAKLSEEDTGRIILKRVWTLVEGHTVDLRNLSAFLHQRHLIVNTAADDFGVFAKAELLAGLRAAQRA